MKPLDRSMLYLLALCVGYMVRAHILWDVDQPVPAAAAPTPEELYRLRMERRQDNKHFPTQREMTTPVSLLSGKDILAVSACALFMGGNQFASGGVESRHATHRRDGAQLEESGSCLKYGIQGCLKVSSERGVMERSSRWSRAQPARITFPAPRQPSVEHIQRQARLGSMSTAQSGSACADGRGGSF